MPRVPFFLDRDPYNAISAKVGGMLEEFALHAFKLYQGGNAKQNLPPPEQESVEAQVLPAKKTQ